MEVTIMQTLLTKAMAMELPPPMPPLARKRSWTEMSHTRSLHTSPSAPARATLAKKSKQTLGSLSGFPLPTADDHNGNLARCRSCDGRLGELSVATLSEGAQRFLEDDPFDFAAPPHPVLSRQQAVMNVCEYMNPIAFDDDDELEGEALDLAPPVIMPTLGKPRWNQSVVGTSLAYGARSNTNSNMLQPRSM